MPHLESPVFAEVRILDKIDWKLISLKTAGRVELSDNFSAAEVPGAGSIVVDSDLTGLRK